ncbi:MAG: lysine--tRNA ligase [Thermoprotei archaeon]|mgnify:CR=1 FL=1|nr:MAG: lysine--tRNA ligase [Thermoprotei archaeon]
MPATRRHFAYRAAEEVVKRFPGESRYVVEAGVTPSGKIHLGNFIDMVLADAVLKALGDIGYDAEGYLIVDSMDPFRQPPSFAPDEFKREAESFIGRPFEALPDPWGCHGNYAEHFVRPVEESFEAYGIALKVKWAGEVHRDENYLNLLIKVLNEREAVRRVLNDVRRRAGHSTLYPEGWIPYRPLCSSCGRIDEAVKPLEVLRGGKVRYKCTACGHEGVADVRRGEGKPPWRVDWPLRWLALNVHFEPLGKDHMASGSGYDTGCALVRDLFKREPPVPVFYDFVYWVENRDGRKVYLKFSKRRGVGLGVDEWLKYAPPEVLRFQILKRDVDDIYREALSHWYFDFRQIPSYVEEFDKFEENYFKGEGGELTKELYRLSLPRPPPPRRPRRVSYYQLVRIAAWMRDAEDGLDMLRKQSKLRGMEEWEVAEVKKRLEMARNWLREVGYAAVLQDLDHALGELQRFEEEVVRAFIEVSRRILKGCDPSQVSGIVREVAESLGLRGRRGRLQVYRAFYRVLLGEDSGPPLRRLVSRPEVRDLLSKIVARLSVS